MRVAIMQPTYLPWMGLFGMLKSADLFVFLDTVQFNHRSWQQRNKILVAGDTKWLTVPVTRPLGQETPIRYVRVNYEHRFPVNHVGKLATNYSKCAHASEFLPGVEEILLERPEGLSDLNIRLIQHLSNLLKIDTQFTSASTLTATGSRAELLLDICRKVNASHYVAAPGSRIYLENFSGFRDDGIEVEYFNFDHPRYSQGAHPFVSHLSIVDALANMGPSWVSTNL